jgi:hypothetical protein
MDIGLIKNNTVVNAVICDSLTDAQTFFPDCEPFDLSASTLGVGWFKDNDKWYPPKPNLEDTFVWNDGFEDWQKVVL